MTQDSRLHPGLWLVPLESTIPEEVQQVALETLFEFTENTKLEYAYQRLLLLVILKWADKDGQFSLKEAAHCFSEFYRLRRETGCLPK
jgi:hypothetical protein